MVCLVIHLVRSVCLYLYKELGQTEESPKLDLVYNTATLRTHPWDPLTPRPLNSTPDIRLGISSKSTSSQEQLFPTPQEPCTPQTPQEPCTPQTPIAPWPCWAVTKEGTALAACYMWPWQLRQGSHLKPQKRLEIRKVRNVKEMW